MLSSQVTYPYNVRAAGRDDTATTGENGLSTLDVIGAAAARALTHLGDAIGIVEEMPRHSTGLRPIFARLTPSKRDQIERRIATSA